MSDQPGRKPFIVDRAKAAKALFIVLGVIAIAIYQNQSEERGREEIRQRVEQPAPQPTGPYNDPQDVPDNEPLPPVSLEPSEPSPDDDDNVGAIIRDSPRTATT